MSVVSSQDTASKTPKPSKKALIVEGGGMRGIFAAGVLDAFLEQDFNPFDAYLGVSAGAITLSSFLSGQAKRSQRVFTEFATQKDFVSLKKFLRGGHYFDLDWLWQESLEALPFDSDKAIEALQGKDFFIVVTSLDTGEALYIKPNKNTWAHSLKASSAVPFIYRNTLKLRGQNVADGGVADPLPVQKALELGSSDIWVIRSRPLSCNSYSKLDSLFTQFAFRRFGKVLPIVKKQAQLYGSALELMKNPPEGISIKQIAPPDALKTKRTSQDLTALNEDYELGKCLGLESIKAGLSKSKYEV